MKQYEEYTDETILAVGKFKFIALGRANPHELLEIYESKSMGNISLFRYVEKNYDKIRDRLNIGSEPVETSQDCKKVKYISKETANSHIKWILEKSKNSHLPVRAYPCDKCTSWHITSQSK